MNGSRSETQRPGSPSSLDALSRTIEGLEARIEGLIGQQAARSRGADEPVSRALPGRRADDAPRSDRDQRPDPLAEIRQRQRALEESRARSSDRSLYSRSEEQAPRAPMRQPLPPLSDPQPTYQPRPAVAAAPAGREIAEALSGLRNELKQDIAESLSREISGLRNEMRSILTLAEESRPQDDMRRDIARLAESLQRLEGVKAPGTDGLRQDFNELRSLMDGLAREDSVRRMERRWDDVEVRLDGLDTGAMRDEIIRIADRLDDIKAQLGGMGDTRAIRALEEKLITVAAALEHIGAHIDPNERMVMEHFSSLDMRLDEITRAIAAGSRNSGPGNDPATFHRLEERLSGLARQIEGISEQRAPQHDASHEMAERLELLTARIEQLSSEQGAARLEERLDQMSYMLERAQKPVPAPELTGYLADISRKIDALDGGAGNDRLADRLEFLAQRIEDLDAPQPVAMIDDSALRNLEDRLNAVVDRLEETSTTGPVSGESASLKGLEDQIAHLSALISQPSPQDPEVTGRISALEDYVATSDEYIIEAARQAAETVMANFSHRFPAGSQAASADISALTALSEHLRQLEDHTRHSEERTHRTFEALHDTLVQIAGRLDELHHLGQPQEAVPLFAQAPIAPAQAARPAESSTPVAPQAPRMVAEPAAEAMHPIDQELLAAADDFAQTMTALPVIDAAREKKAPKPSLLAGLGKKLMPGKKAPKAPAEARQTVDTAPSIDPVDVLPPDDANELLEPGSGAPDVRKILERVRASQQAAKTGTSTEDNGDRTDYIAAARRAAQAAAMEMDRAQKTTPSANKAMSDAKAKSKSAGPSLFARYRRPILMAVGAILLAAMAMPLVNTLTRGEAPPVVEDIAPAETSEIAPADQPADTALPATAAVDANPAVATASSDAPAESQEDLAATLPASVPDVSSAAPVQASGAAPVSALMAPVSNTPAQSLETPASAPVTDTIASAQPQTAEASNVVVAEEVTAQAPAADIVVPADITPPSLSIAAKNGDPLALFEIGARYTEGRGVKNDFAEAAKWYRLAADKGLALAQYRLANFLEKGTGVAPDIDAAKRYYEMAANAGNASAMHNLAVIYASGKDGAQDYAKAVEWFTKAADHGVSDSQFNLAILSARGNGTSPDLVTSYKWFAIAAKGGDTDAAQKRDEVANALKPDQLERARAEVDLWKPKELNPDANSANTPDEWAGKGLKTASVDMKKAIRNIQAILNKNGFDAGTPDGLMGAKTVSAIKAFQTSIGQQPTGQVTDKLVTELLERNK
ncbi:peptidoglycan-binding protein [Rhizobium rhizophilum]|uniref:Peptidoglycan-binding protein n=1 Tax=Rhizobium rhizophilum TaxID=1850373 RepID=A0ABY2R190_9HYPH|nr:peptidoglycan-binding protein [Rhizobium rhizophilum]THV17589.1 peptidoglycan-binding protein [Rhizobium rhizophilum]